MKRPKLALTSLSSRSIAPQEMVTDSMGELIGRYHYSPTYEMQATIADKERLAVDDLVKIRISGAHAQFLADKLGKFIRHICENPCVKFLENMSVD